MCETRWIQGIPHTLVERGRRALAVTRLCDLAAPWVGLLSIVTVAAAVSKARTFQEYVLRPRAVLVYVLLKGVR